MIDHGGAEFAKIQEERTVSLRTNEEVARIKDRAFQMMSLLEGWCSTSKAAVLIDLIMMLKPEVVVEIGVFGGKSVVPMAYALSQNKQGKVYGIDPWDTQMSVEGQDGLNKDYWMQIDHDAILEGLKQKIITFRLSSYIELIRDTSANAKPIQNIDILHIDGNHSVPSALIDLNKWVPLVKRGGLIVFDDMYWAGETAPVDWLNANCIKLTEFVEGNRWGMWIKP